MRYETARTKSPISSPTGSYKYTDHLIALERCIPPVLLISPLPLPSKKVSTPLKVEVWRATVSSHPDIRFAQYIITALVTDSGSALIGPTN